MSPMLKGLVFGQHKIGGTIIGAGLWALAVCGMAYGWLGPVGYALWFLCLLAGTFAVCIVGHGILFILPLLLILDIMERWRNRGGPS